MSTTETHMVGLQAAREALALMKKSVALKSLTAAVHSLPLLLQRHGVGQTMAYLQIRGEGKPGSPYSMIAKHLTGWLQQTMGVTGADALRTIADRDSRFYREAAEQSWLFVKCLHKLLEEAS